MKILYMTSGEVWKLTGNSIQILDEMKHLRANGHHVDLLILPHYRQLSAIQAEISALRSTMEDMGAELLQCPLLMGSLIRFSRLQILYHALRIKLMIRNRNYDLVSSHDIRTAAIAVKLKSFSRGSLRIAYDMHGAGIAEAIYLDSYKENSRDATIRAAMEQEAINCADLIFVVSKPFSNWVVDHYHANPDKVWRTPSSCEVPPLPEPSWRNSKRQELGLGDEPVILYSGSIQRWQRVEDVFRIFPRLREQIPGLTLLVLTPHLDQARELLRDSGVAEDSFRLVRANADEVQRFMSIADIGVLLRHRHLLNEVASPVKFADYLAAGVPVLLSAHIGDCDEIAEQSGLSVVWDEEEDSLENLAKKLTTLLENRSEQQRSSCNELARRHFSWQETMNVFQEAFRSLKEDAV
jgi:glycosyltransferase involved in cell wall biosynthesis